MNWDIQYHLNRNPTLARFYTLSTTGKGAAILVVLLLGWTALEQWSWSWARQWNAKADRIEQALSDSRELASGAEASAILGAELYGPINPPASESEGAEAMAQAVVEIVKRHNTTGFSYDAQRASSRLSGAATLGTGQKLSKVTGELQFEATPEEAAKIIVEMEASPSIEAINSIRLQRREGELKVNVRMTVEAWVFSARSTGRMS